MRRGTLLIVGLLLGATAIPQTADARPRLLRALQGIVTAPLGILGAVPRVAHPSRSHRRAATRAPRPAAAAPAAAVAGTAAAGAAATGAAAAAVATSPAASTTGVAPSQEPSPSLVQRNAALSAPDERAAADRSRTAEQPAGRLGTVGPLAWPSAYEDVIGFTLWPKDYGERLRTHGIGDVLSTALAPSAAIAARTRHARADEPNQPPSPQGVSVCGSVDLTATDWPIAQIRSVVELDETQNAALDQFRTALSDAVASIKSTCRDDASLGPVERLRLMQNMLWAVHDASQTIRAPLARFYESLTDEQKSKFSAPAAPQPANARLSRNEMARMCDLPNSAEALRQIEQSIKPTKAQKASLEALQKKAFEMGQFLMASCLKPVPATPAERLDAASERLTAVIFAASNVNMALNDFTSQLSDDQKGRLNTMVR